VPTEEDRLKNWFGGMSTFTEVSSVLGTLTGYGIAERYHSVRQGWPMV